MKCLIIKLFVVAQVLLCTACGQSSEKHKLSEYVRELSSERYEGRRSGSKGNILAGNYIAGKFAEFKLQKPLKDSYFQLFPLVEKYIGKSYIVAGTDTLTNFHQYIAPHYTDIPDEVEMRLVFAGSGTDEELEKIDVSGKMALVFTNSLRNTYQINEKLKHRGAFGLIAANPKNDDQFSNLKRTSAYLLKKSILAVNNDTASPLYQWEHLAPKYIQEFVIDNGQVAKLMKLSISQLIDFEKNINIQQAPERKIKLQHKKIRREFWGRNIVGLTKGISEKTIVISAHYDHLGKSGEGYFPGADDNASGVAALLALAEEFSQKDDLKYRLIFLAADAEEQGMLGAEYFIEHLPLGKLDDVIINLNIDMIGRSDKALKKNGLYVIGDLDARFMDLFNKADMPFTACDFDYDNKNEKDYFTRGDQYVFAKKGIPSVMFFSGLHNDYHTPQDTPDKIDYKLIDHRLRLISETLKAILENY